MELEGVAGFLINRRAGEENRCRVHYRSESGRQGTVADEGPTGPLRELAHLRILTAGPRLGFVPSLKSGSGFLVVP